MINLIRLIHCHPAPAQTQTQTDHLLQILRVAGDAREVQSQWLGHTLPGVRNGGDLIWRLAFDDDAAADSWEHSASTREALNLLSAHAEHIDMAHYAQGVGGTRSANLRNGIYRALLLHVEPNASAEQVEQLETDLLAMPRYIGKILNWRLSRVSASGGTLAWTHVWEQEFAALEDLKQDYVWHPYHWGVVDRWFDPEMPCRIVHPSLCHSFAAIERSIL